MATVNPTHRLRKSSELLPPGTRSPPTRNERELSAGHTGISTKSHEGFPYPPSSKNGTILVGAYRHTSFRITDDVGG
eukprot:2973030-Rhodomonas_salina.4